MDTLNGKKISSLEIGFRTELASGVLLIAQNVLGCILFVVAVLSGTVSRNGHYM